MDDNTGIVLTLAVVVLGRGLEFEDCCVICGKTWQEVNG